MKSIEITCFLLFKVKQLAKVHKDKAELDRMKREVAKSTVEKGVNECTRLTNIYDKKRAELERQHEEVRQRLEEERAKVCVLTIINITNEKKKTKK